MSATRPRTAGIATARQQAVPGPMAGVVLGVKDVIDVAGMLTTHGSAILREHREP
ncbi:MAG: hypothetical protein IPF97_11195 [Sphingomonadales bacterium]|nr:hypothetical protein [Sphingomonadales bacterium]